MKITAKKLLPLALVGALLAGACYLAGGEGMSVNIDGDELGGPLGALLGVLLASGGLALAAVIMLATAALVGLLFAGLGILMIAGIAVLAVVVAAAVSPLLLPLLVPAGLYWFFVVRGRQQRRQALQALPV